MSNIHRTLVPALLAAASLCAWAAGEGTNESRWDQFKAYTHQQKNAAVAEGKKVIAEADKKIDELSKQASNSGAEAKAAHDKNMKELLAKKKQAQVQLDKLEKSSSGAWDATKEGFAGAARELRQAYDKAVATATK
jgi:hypothetical protein